MLVYKVGKNRKQAAHIWDDTQRDTYCTMWTTGGIKSKGKYKESDSPGSHRVCVMCQVNYKKSHKRAAPISRTIVSKKTVIKSFRIIEITDELKDRYLHLIGEP